MILRAKFFENQGGMFNLKKETAAHFENRSPAKRPPYSDGRDILNLQYLSILSVITTHLFKKEMKTI